MTAEERAKAIVEQWEKQTDWGTELIPTPRQRPPAGPRLVQMIAAALEESYKRIAELEEIGRVYCRDTDQHIEQLIADLDTANKRVAELEAQLK